jgi:hypothetical protein
MESECELKRSLNNEFITGEKVVGKDKIGCMRRT